MKDENMFDIEHMGSMDLLKHKVLPRLKPTDYEKMGWGFLLKPEGRIIVKNQQMLPRAEKEIRKFIGLPPNESKPLEKKAHAMPTTEFKAPILAEKLQQATTVATEKKSEKKIEKMKILISSYGKSISFFIPVEFIGMRFSVQWEGKSFLLMRDDQAGIMVNHSTCKPPRGVINFGSQKWFASQQFCKFYSQKFDSDFDGESFMVTVPYLFDDDRVEASPPPMVIETKAEEKPKETQRDRAKRYINWLNAFCERNDYAIKTEGNKLVLERQDRIE